jgi:drug/metabolite transporter (DMT)-like permease
LNNARASGVMLVLISAFVFSSAGIFTKGVDTDAWGVIFWRGLSAALLTVIYCMIRGTFKKELSKFGIPAFFAALFMAAGTSAFIPAFKLTSIANVALIWAAAPLIAALMAWLALREKPKSRIIIASALAMIGVGILVNGSIGNAESIKGDMLALIMTVLMSAAMVVYRKYPQTPAALPAALASLMLLPFALYSTDVMNIPTGELPVLIGFGLVFAIASVTLNEGVRRIPVSEAALLGSLETPLAPIWAFLILSEIPTFPTFAGGAVIFSAIIYSQFSRKKFRTI